MTDALEDVRRALLRVHRALVDAERAEHERRHGAVTGAEFLHALMDDLRYAWLRPLSELVIAFDETEEEAAKAGEPVRDDAARTLVDAVRRLVAPPDSQTAFGRRYADLLQREPELVLAHGALVQQLARLD